MSKSRNVLALLLSCTVLIGAVAFPVDAYNRISNLNPTPDSNIVTTYAFYNNFAGISLTVCGSTARSSGCYKGTTLGQFGHVGAMIEGNETVNVATQTVTRKIYVVDQSFDGGTGTRLYIFTKTDVVDPTYDTVTVELTDSVTLPLVGGANVRTSLAANANTLYIGTDQTPFVVAVNKSTLAQTQTGDFMPPLTVSSISANRYGYVTVTFGGLNNSSGSGYYVFKPNGAVQQDGGGAVMMMNTMVGTTTLNLPVMPAPLVGTQVHYKSK